MSCEPCSHSPKQRKADAPRASGLPAIREGQQQLVGLSPPHSERERERARERARARASESESESESEGESESEREGEGEGEGESESESERERESESESESKLSRRSPDRRCLCPPVPALRSTRL